MSQPPTHGPVSASNRTSPLFGDLVEEIVRGVLREQLPGETAAVVAEEVGARIAMFQSAWQRVVGG
jgi:hypothetical protein